MSEPNPRLRAIKDTKGDLIEWQGDCPRCGQLLSFLPASKVISGEAYYHCIYKTCNKLENLKLVGTKLTVVGGYIRDFSFERRKYYDIPAPPLDDGYEGVTLKAIEIVASYLKSNDK